VVLPGASLVDVGNPLDLEIVANLLSTDANCRSRLASKDWLDDDEATFENEYQGIVCQHVLN
jgi:hypothetical protein